MHAFWKEADQQARMQETVQFLKNVARLGGVLLAGAQPGPWPYAAAAIHRSA